MKKTCISCGMKRKMIQYTVYLVLLFVFIFLTFHHLGQASIQNWDEARHGISAYEMLQTDNYIVNTYRYEADLWNLKPPLSFWMIAASFKIFGYCVLALRIPSAICFTLMFILIAGHLHKRYGFASTVTYMVLFLSYSDLFLSHFGRSADADALYNLLVVGAVLALFCSNQSKRWDRWLYLSGFLASLAFLSKSFHAIAVYAIIAAYAVLRKELRSVRVYSKLAIAAFFSIFIWMVFRFFADGFDFLGSMFGVDVVDRIHNFQAEIQTKGAESIIHYLLHYRPSQILLIIIVFSGMICLIDTLRKESLLSIVRNQNVWLYSLWFLIPTLFFEMSSATMTWYYYPSVISIIVIAAVLMGKSVRIILGILATEKKIICNTLALAVVCEMVMILVFSSRSVVGTYRVISADEKPYEQVALLTLLSRDSEHAGKEAYILKDANSYRQTDEWEQCDVLAAELAADLRCHDGGIEVFLNSADSILMISEKQYMDNKDCLNGYPILCEDGHYLVLTH